MDQNIGFLALFALVVCVCVKLLFDYSKIKEHEEKQRYKRPKNNVKKDSVETVDPRINNTAPVGNQYSETKSSIIENSNSEAKGVSVTSSYCKGSKTLTMSVELPTTLKTQRPLNKNNIVELNTNYQVKNLADAKQITFINSRSTSAKKLSRLLIYYDSETSCISLMSKDGGMLLDDFPLNNPYGGKPPVQLAKELRSNIICFFDEASHIKNALTKLVLMVFPTQTFSIRLYDVKKQYYKYVPERPNRNMSILNAVKNVGLLEYGKQPDSNQLKCERTLSLNDFLFARENTIVIEIYGLDKSIQVNKCDVRSIQNLPDNHIFLIDYDRLTENSKFVGTFESLQEADELHSYICANNAYIIRSPKSTVNDCRLIAYVPESIEESLSYRDYYRQQYTAKAHTDRKRIQQAFLKGFNSSIRKLRITFTFDYIAANMKSGDTIYLREKSHIDCFKHGAFRLNLTDADNNLLASTINSNKGIIELLWQASARDYEAHIQSVDTNKKQISTLFNFD